MAPKGCQPPPALLRRCKIKGNLCGQAMPGETVVDARTHGQQCVLQRKAWETASASNRVGFTVLKWVVGWLRGWWLLPRAGEWPRPPDLISP